MELVHRQENSFQSSGNDNSLMEELNLLNGLQVETEGGLSINLIILGKLVTYIASQEPILESALLLMRWP